MRHQEAESATAQTDYNRRTALYRFYDREGRLLYLGVAYNPEERWRSHADTAPWWRDAASRTVDWHETRGDALQAERDAIVTEGPLYNKVFATSDARAKRVGLLRSQGLAEGATALEEVCFRFKIAEEEQRQARIALEQGAVRALQSGRPMSDVVRITGWTHETLRRLKEKAELESLRRKVDELSATKKPSPAAATPRQQVTQAVPKPEPIDLTGISPEVAALSMERVRELAASAEARQPQWVAEIREEYPDANELRLCYLIVDTGFRQGRKPPELVDASTPDPADRPAGSEETSG